MMKMKKQLLLRGLILSILFLCSSIPAFGAKLYLDSGTDEYGFGATVSFVVRLDTEDECINAISGEFSFSNNILTDGKFYYGDSLFSLWVRPPEIDQKNGKITFVGGIPGGYCGKISGDPGTEGVIGEIIFKSVGMIIGGPRNLSATVEPVATSQVLLNDGLGTPAKLTLEGKTIKIISNGPKFPQHQAPGELTEKELKSDKTSPEPFVIELRKDSKVLDGKYFIIFSTTDKQTGVDYYEIKEGDEKWIKASSPYLLEDQRLRGVIEVRAWDKAGNYRSEQYVPDGVIVKKPAVTTGTKSEKEQTSSNVFQTLIISVSLFLLIVAVAAYLMAKRNADKK